PSPCAQATRTVMSTPSSGPPPTQPHPDLPPGPPAKKDMGPGKIAAALAYLLRGRRRPGEVVIVSHSNLFYWWPVWLVGFVMAAITYFDNVHAGFVVGHPRVVTLAGEHEYKFDDPVTDEEKAKFPKKDIHAIITDRNDNPFPTTRHGGEEKHMFPYMTSNKNVGVIFAITLLVVIVVTNVPLRGLWSVIVIITIVLGSIIFALAGWWDIILTHGRLLAIHVNMGAYLFISLTLFIIWVVNVFFFDRQRYTIVTSGQVRLQL